jgi:hypothetical protein
MGLEGVPAEAGTWFVSSIELFWVLCIVVDSDLNVEDLSA